MNGNGSWQPAEIESAPGGEAHADAPGSESVPASSPIDAALAENSAPDAPLSYVAPPVFVAPPADPVEEQTTGDAESSGESYFIQDSAVAEDNEEEWDDGDDDVSEQDNEADSENEADVAFEEDNEAAERADAKARLMTQFEQWVDGMLAGEPPPAGLPEELLVEAEDSVNDDDAPADAGADLYTLFSALTTLSGEIRLQGRTFKQLADTLAPVSEFPTALEKLHAAQLSTSRSLERFLEREQQERSRDAALPPVKEVLNVVFDLYDRLERGLRTLDAGIESLRAQPAGGFLARLAGTQRQNEQAVAATQSIGEGYRLILSRLEAALHQWGIERTGEEGELFDPTRMVVVEVQAGSTEPDGMVLEVYRSGYASHGKVLATAQVKVAKATGERK